MALVAMVVAVLAAMVLLDLLLPPYPSRWHVPLIRTWERMRPTHPVEPDPFVALRLQQQLGAVSDQIRRLDGDPHVYARAHRLEAARAAYDDLLAEACALACIPTPTRRPRAEMRWEEEQELMRRGWTW